MNTIMRTLRPSRPLPARPLLAFILSIAVLSSTIPFMACNSSQVLSDVERFEPAVLDALTLACTISSGLPICGSMQTTITNDYTIVVKLWTQYNADLAAGTSTVAAWNALNAAFEVFEQDSSQILQLGLGLNVPELTAIIAAAQVLLAAIEALFPGPPAGAQAGKRLFSKYGLGQPAGTYTAQWFKGWAKNFNTDVDTAHKRFPKASLKRVHAGFFPF